VIGNPGCTPGALGALGLSRGYYIGGDTYSFVSIQKICNQINNIT
jgi:hypothetical protein